MKRLYKGSSSGTYLYLLNQLHDRTRSCHSYQLSQTTVFTHTESQKSMCLILRELFTELIFFFLLVKKLL